MGFPIQKNRKKILSRIFICIFFFVMPIASSGQQYHFKNYNIEDGLAQSQVRSIFQDSKGFLWIGTLGGGVSKYDGLEFKNYSAIEGLCDNNMEESVDTMEKHSQLSQQKMA